MRLDERGRGEGRTSLSTQNTTLTCIHILRNSQFLSHHQGRDGARVLHDLQPAKDVASSVCQGLALLVDNALGDTVRVLADQVLQFHHDALTRQDGRLAPFLKSLLRGASRCPELLRCGLGNPCYDLLSCLVVNPPPLCWEDVQVCESTGYSPKTYRVPDINPLLGRRLNKFAVNVEFGGVGLEGRHCCGEGAGDVDGPDGGPG
ncbi:hypothetical protein BC938DRAFT_483912 [Jimgerdemannia flammicorona]|uniref:Uncharacterized protein n=1 Tax=Jimgerdemannia flammicorona TaxID=994334 RepID=A0A433QB33_9FUNG|nr:hypothetical protein BC938DRAFT_483912 [Jimgerdemannia flammicorona]